MLEVAVIPVMFRIMDLLALPAPADLGPAVVARTCRWLVPLANRLPSGDLGSDDVRVMHPIADFVMPVPGHLSWLVQRGHGSFVTMDFGSPEVDVREPRLMPVFIEGAQPRRTSATRSSPVNGISGSTAVSGR